MNLLARDRILLYPPGVKRMSDGLSPRNAASVVEMFENGTGFYRHDSNFVIFPGEGAHRIQGVKPHDGDKLHFVGQVAAQ